MKKIGAILLALCLVRPAAAAPPEKADATTTETKKAEKTKPEKQKPFVFAKPGEVSTIDEKSIERMLGAHGGKLLVVNFWATWCSPCVAELPDFAKAAKEYKDREVLFVGLSADFADQAKKRVEPFVKKKKVPYPVYVLDVDPNKLLPKISKQWNGTLPATFYYDKDGKQLGARLKRLHAKELNADLDKYLKLGKASGKQEAKKKPAGKERT